MNLRAIIICLVFSFFWFSLPAHSNGFSFELQTPELQQDPDLIQERLGTQKSAEPSVKTAQTHDDHSAPGGSPINEHAESLNPEMDADLGFSDVPHLTLRGFADLSYIAVIKGPEEKTSFSAGQVSLLIYSQLSEKINFLAETFFSNPPTGQSTFTLARAKLQYLIAEYFNVEIGQMHTRIGYWNHAFHHGTWLMTTVERPELFRQDQSYIPIHSFGVEVFGFKSFYMLDMEYAFDVFNGRGVTPNQVVRVVDQNNSKAVNFYLNLKPHFIPGLRFGTSLYLDTIPPNPPVATRTGEIYERIIAGDAVYYGAHLELLGEIAQIYHDDDTSQRVYTTLGFYLQGGYKMGKFTPYYRFDYMDFTDGEPYFIDTADKSVHTAGLRWDIITWNALKLEYSYTNLRQSKDTQAIVINSSFTF